MTGRPSSFSQETADAICDRLSAGETLRAICRDDAMPDQTTVFRWIRTLDDFRQQYALARETQADTWADELVEIADDGTNDYVRRNHGEDDEGWRVNGEHIQRSRLRVDARKWLMSKSAPKKYGEKITSEIGGIDGKPIEVSAVTDLDRAKALAAMIAKTRAAASEG